MSTTKLPAIPFLREQVKMQRALSPEQPGVIRLSCFDAEDLLAVIDAAEEWWLDRVPQDDRERALVEALAVAHPQIDERNFADAR